MTSCTKQTTTHTAADVSDNQATTNNSKWNLAMIDDVFDE